MRINVRPNWSHARAVMARHNLDDGRDTERKSTRPGASPAGRTSSRDSSGDSTRKITTRRPPLHLDSCHDAAAACLRSLTPRSPFAATTIRMRTISSFLPLSSFLLLLTLLLQFLLSGRRLGFFLGRLRRARRGEWRTPSLLQVPYRCWPASTRVQERPWSWRWPLAVSRSPCRITSCSSRGSGGRSQASPLLRLSLRPSGGSTPSRFVCCGRQHGRD
jgi:hypothetical protein